MYLRVLSDEREQTPNCMGAHRGGEICNAHCTPIHSAVRRYAGPTPGMYASIRMRVGVPVCVASLEVKCAMALSMCEADARFLGYFLEVNS